MPKVVGIPLIVSLCFVAGWLCCDGLLHDDLPPVNIHQAQFEPQPSVPLVTRNYETPNYETPGDYDTTRSDS